MSNSPNAGVTSRGGVAGAAGWPARLAGVCMPAPPPDVRQARRRGPATYPPATPACLPAPPPGVRPARRRAPPRSPPVLARRHCAQPGFLIKYRKYALSTRRASRHARSWFGDDRSAADRRDAAHDGAAGRDPGPRARTRSSRLRHDLAGRGVSVVAQAPDGGSQLNRAVRADREGDRPADGRVGHHLAVHPAPDPGGDGRPRYPGARPRPLPPRLRRQPDLHEGDRSRRRQAAQPHAGRRTDRARGPRGRRVQLRRARRSRRSSPRSPTRRRPRAAASRSTSPAPARGCSATPARRPTGC